MKPLQAANKINVGKIMQELTYLLGNAHKRLVNVSANSLNSQAI